MELTDAQIRAYFAATKQTKFALYGKTTSAVVAALAATGMLFSGETSAFYSFFQFLFVFFTGSFTIYAVAGRIFMKHFDSMLDIATLTVNSDESNISRLAKIQEKRR